MTRFIPLLLLVVLSATAQNPEVNKYLAEARTAVTNKDYPLAYEKLTKAHALHPYHQAILYNLGVMAAATGHPDESISNLRKALHINAGYKLDVPQLASVKDRPDFQELIALQKDLQKVVTNSDTAAVLKDRNLHAESATVDPQTGTLYIGSVHKRKIVAVDKEGKASDFIASGTNGLTAVLGVRVDAQGKFLWACSSPMEEVEGTDTLAPSRVFKFDLATRKLVSQFEPAAKGGHVFGDLAIAPNGQVYVSDSKTNEIYKVNETTKKLELFSHDKEFWNIQGITFSNDGKYMFISDYIKGPYRLDMATRKLEKIGSQVDSSLKGIDGMLFYSGSLLTLQNGTSPFRVMRFKLNPTLDTIVAAEIIDQGRAELNEPTQGALVGNDFYYVATSQWGGYDDQKMPKAPELLEDIIILKYRLEK